WLGGEALGVGRMAEVTAGVEDIARRALARVLQQPALLRRAGTAFAVRAMTVRWAKPISPLFMAWTLSGSCSRFLPTATAAPAGPLFRWQWWRIQSIGLVEPCSSYSSVRANSAAVAAKSSSRLSMA